jgi:hypothetical protein
MRLNSFIVMSGIFARRREPFFLSSTTDPSFRPKRSEVEKPAFLEISKAHAQAEDTTPDDCSHTEQTTEPASSDTP